MRIPVLSGSSRRRLSMALLVVLTGVLVAMAQPARRSATVPPKGAAKPVSRFGLSEPLPRTSGAVRLAAYNMLNFFDQVDDPTLSGEFDDLPMATPLARCEKLAETIRTVNADVIALEEVESDVALRWFRDTYLRDMGYASVASLDAGYYRGVEQSVLSRYEIVEAKVWPNLSITDVRRSGDGWQDVPADKRSSLTFQRSPLMVTVRVRPDYLLTLFVVHHKAGGSGLKYHREAEALKIVELARAVMREDPSRNVAILGDFNAAPWDKSMRVYLEAGFVDTLAHRTTWKDDPEMPLFKTHESDRVLDYILLNSAAYREFVPGSAHVYGTLTPPSSYDYRTDPQPEGYASDHYPVIIELMPHDLK